MKSYLTAEHFLQLRRGEVVESSRPILHTLSLGSALVEEASWCGEDDLDHVQGRGSRSFRKVSCKNTRVFVGLSNSSPVLTFEDEQGRAPD